MNCALVTGGSRGIGKATALKLSKDFGLHILINYSHNDDHANAVVDLIHAAGGSAELLKFNVQHRKEVDAAISNWEAQNPDKYISVLVNNAGIVRDGLFAWMNEENWKKVLSVSLDGLYNVTQRILPFMLKRKSGRIINVSSISGVKGLAGQVNYSTAKAGIIGATKSLAQELAKMKITVNAVAPGFINTEMLANVDLKKVTEQIPVKRLGQPEEVAALIAFLASNEAAYITGEVIHINGGLYS